MYDKKRMCKSEITFLVHFQHHGIQCPLAVQVDYIRPAEPDRFLVIDLVEEEGLIPTQAIVQNASIAMYEDFGEGRSRGLILPANLTAQGSIKLQNVNNKVAVFDGAQNVGEFLPTQGFKLTKIVVHTGGFRISGFHVPN